MSRNVKLSLEQCIELLPIGCQQYLESKHYHTLNPKPVGGVKHNSKYSHDTLLKASEAIFTIGDDEVRQVLVYNSMSKTMMIELYKAIYYGLIRLKFVDEKISQFLSIRMLDVFDVSKVEAFNELECLKLLLPSYGPLNKTKVEETILEF